MQIEGWQYYNHAAMPTTIPCENPDIKPVENGNVWQIGGVLRFSLVGQVSLTADTKPNGGM